MKARLKFHGHDNDSKRKLLITRSPQKSQPLISKLALRDVETVPFPVNKLVPLENPPGWDDIKSRLDDYDMLIFTSANSINYFFELMHKEGVDPKFARDKLVAVVGEKTAMEAVRFESKKVIVSPVATGAGLASHLKSAFAGKPLKALLPVSRKAPTKIRETLENSGWQIERLEIYDSMPEEKENLPEVDPSEIDYACFTSPLTVEYLRAYIDIPDEWIVISIGPSTSAKLKECGLRVDWELPNSNLEWLWQVL
jgi:uroporphyrinogen-III synthase